MERATIKPFVVFAWLEYEPSGGWGDYRDSFDTIEQARTYVDGLEQHYEYDIIEIRSQPPLETVTPGTTDGLASLIGADEAAIARGELPSVKAIRRITRKDAAIELLGGCIYWTNRNLTREQAHRQAAETDWTPEDIIKYSQFFFGLRENVEFVEEDA